jgi:hypothetical protein
MVNVFNAIVASLTGEFAFLTQVEKTAVRVFDRPRRERPVRVAAPALPKAGFRHTMRGLK